jgi:uncharacterized Fe-S cluster protein YjdI
MRIFEKTNITSNTGTLVHSGQCVLRYITVNTTAAGAITVADAITATTPVVAILKSNCPCGTYRYDCVMAKGIYVTTAASSDITVVWEKL